MRTAAHLVDSVLPRVPYRQWVLALPRRLRYFLHRNAAHAGAVLGIFLRGVETAIRAACPRAPRKARFGAVSFIHRAGSSFNEHLHYHSLVTDGLFAAGAGGQAEFFEATGFGEEHLDQLTEKLRRRILRYLVRKDLVDDQVAADMAGWDHHGGFSLDASVRVEEWDRLALERLVRYASRPPFAVGRLGLHDPETVVYTLPTPDPQGRSIVILTPLELLHRLCSLIPPPRVHRHRYRGVLAPNCPLRCQVVATAGPAQALADRLEEAAQKMGLREHGEAQRPDMEDAQDNPPTEGPETSPRRRASRLSWAMLLARIYEILPAPLSQVLGAHEDHRLHHRPAGDPSDPQPSEPAGRAPAARPGQTIAGATPPRRPRPRASGCACRRGNSLLTLVIPDRPSSVTSVKPPPPLATRNERCGAST